MNPAEKPSVEKPSVEKPSGASKEREELEARLGAVEARNQDLAAILVQLAGAGGGRVGRKWDASAAIIASLIGLLALAVSAYTAHLQRQQLQATVWPKLFIANSNLPPKFYLFNRGLGPGLVKAVRVTVDGKPMRSWHDVVGAFGYGGEAGIHYSAINGLVFPADKDMEIAWPRDQESRTMLLDVMASRTHQFSITLCYCSVMQDCYVTAYGRVPAGDRARVDRGDCPVAESDQFDN